MEGVRGNPNRCRRHRITNTCVCLRAETPVTRLGLRVRGERAVDPPSIGHPQRVKAYAKAWAAGEAVVRCGSRPFCC